MAEASTPTPSPSYAPPQHGWQPETGVRNRNVALLRAVQELRGCSGRVLEVGAGTGRFLRALRRRIPNLEGHACDLTPAGLTFAHRQDSSLAVVQGDLTALPYQASSFNVVLVFDVLEHLHYPQRGLTEIHRVLTPGGLLHALVPCEGQPLTLHWLMWKLNLGADLKEKSVGHVQRFTQRNVTALLEGSGFELQHLTYSMHPLGQIKDVLMHLEQRPAFPSWLRRNLLYRILSLALWGGAYVESTCLRHLSLGSVALHVTAKKR